MCEPRGTGQNVSFCPPQQQFLAAIYPCVGKCIDLQDIQGLVCLFSNFPPQNNINFLRLLVINYFLRQMRLLDINIFFRPMRLRKKIIFPINEIAQNKSFFSTNEITQNKIKNIRCFLIQKDKMSEILI